MRYDEQCLCIYCVHNPRQRLGGDALGEVEQEKHRAGEDHTRFLATDREALGEEWDDSSVSKMIALSMVLITLTGKIQLVQ